MTDSLLALVRRHAEGHRDAFGAAKTPIPSLTAIVATAKSELQYAINRPLVALVLQGSKRVSMGSRTFDFGAGESLLITADVPTVSQITRASPNTPYFSLVLDLDPAVVAELSQEMKSQPEILGAPVRVDPTEAEVADAALRLMRLVERPSSLQVLQRQVIRELHYWLLEGRHGPAIRALGAVDSHATRISRAISMIRSDYASTLRVERLAEVAAMSTSSFHQHFRAITSLTPLQFQKQLRLIEARRLMLSEGSTVSSAALAVGYESISQFTREYGRMFGMPPVKEIKTTLGRLSAAA